MTKQDEMAKIAKLAEQCKECNLYNSRKKPVVGEGSLDAKVLFIGEAPGRNEDIQGRPFVGRAGEILDELLDSIGIKRSEVFVVNTLKCRPPDNRNPLQSEIESCRKYLDRQIEIIKPKVIVTLGNFASSYIFEKFGLKYDKISKIHGKIFRVNTIFGKLSIIPLYHPAVATYNINTKKTLLDDFKLVKKAIEES